ncbi:hypothetical protein M3Y94_00993400 [Aphelenchoides besseyi]|nr:hypothetical protein M3Y94_00993400 [Aphelenchoides besseyi]
MSVWIPLVAVTAFWVLVGAGGPFLVPSGPNRGNSFVFDFLFLINGHLQKHVVFSGIIQTMIILTAVCCHLFWIIVYLHQLNPLIGPQIPVKTIWWINQQWGHVEAKP